MKTTEKWRSLKVRDSQYEALAACSERTGRPIIRLGEEALKWFIAEVIPVYNNASSTAQETIKRKLHPAKPKRKKTRRKAAPRTQVDPVETVTIQPS